MYQEDYKPKDATRPNNYVRFDSISEFYRYAEAEVNMDNFTYSSKEAINHADTENKTFKGLSNENIEASKFGYAEGVEALKLMPELNIKSGGVKFAYKWDDHDGDDMNMERYYEGMPAMRRRYKTAGDKLQGRFVEIKIQIDENASVDYTCMLWKTYAACRIIDQLEDVGVRVKVTVCTRCNMFAETYNYAALDIAAKNYNEPLNIALLANVCSPWFFRFFVFKFYAKHYRLTSPGIGKSASFRTAQWPEDEAINNKDRRDIIFIGAGQCLSNNDADNFIKALEI